MINDSTSLQFLKYNIVGIFNTLIGFSLVFGFIYLGLGNMLSNFLGYFIGVFISFFLNRKFTFKKYNITSKVIFWFFSILLFAYLINASVFFVFINFYNMSPYLAQIFSGAIYTLLSFSLMKKYLFNNSNMKDILEK